MWGARSDIWHLPPLHYLKGQQMQGAFAYIPVHTDTVSTDIIQTTEGKQMARGSNEFNHYRSTIPKLLAGAAPHTRFVVQSCDDVTVAESQSNHVRHTNTHDVRMGDLQGCSASPAVPPEECIEIVNDKLLREERLLPCPHISVC